jgi:septal ring-binding cell division protein DamX
MPDLNLNEEGAMDEQTPSEQPSEPDVTLPQHAAGGQATRMVIILVVVAVLAGTAYMLNKLGIIKLWGTKAPTVAQVGEPEPAKEQPAETPTQQPVQAPVQQPEPTTQTPAHQSEKQPSEKEKAPPAASMPEQEHTVAKQETMPEVQEQASPPLETKPVETPPIETKPPGAKKAEEPPRMLFKLKDPIVFSPKSRTEKSTAQREQTASETAKEAKKEVATEKPKEPAPALRITVPQQHQRVDPQQQAVSHQKTVPVQQSPAATQRVETKHETSAQSLQPKQEAKPKVEAPKPKVSAKQDMKGMFTIQVYALRERENAEAVAKRLSDVGYPAFVEPIEAKGMVWYTVRIGRYPSATEARKAVENFAQEIKEHHFIDKVRTKEN